MQQEFYGDQQIYLGQFVDLRRFQGMRLTGVTLVAATRQGYGYATFCTTQGCATLPNIGNYLTPQRFNIRDEWVNRSANGWVLQLNGTIYVGSIHLEFER